MRPRVLYILGYGRSGSTILGMALGQHPAVFNMGEVISLRGFVGEHRRQRPRTCGCQELVEQCPFWQRVAQQVPLDADLRIPTSMGWRHYAPWLPPLSSELSRWATHNTGLFSSVLEAAGAQIVVDASKRADRAWWLWASGMVDVIPLWLTRAFKAVLRSEHKLGNNRLKAAVHWHVAQRRAAQLVGLIESAGGKVLRGTYEEMTSDPQAFLSGILSELGLPWNEATLQPRANHTVGGNHQAKFGGRTTIERQAA